MNADSMETLLDALSGTDEDAAERAYVACEPLLRMLVRRRLTPRLRSQFDSADVVQSVWAELVDGLRTNRWQFADASQLRGFLVRVTSNRVIDRVRAQRLARRYEEAQTGPDRSDPSACPASPSELAQAGELWERMLAACPPDRRPILALRRQGLTTAEIAARVGLNEGSVRRILGRLARRFARADAGPDPK